MNTLLSRAEAAQRLGISLVTFDRIYKKCGLPYIQIGHSVKIPSKELDEWITRNITRNTQSTEQR
ncbi:MAG: helix-turn-helix domain-containing protein [Oscillospiraceae bacterium]|nr:helix-turn-helix domain-containing protein [Oscillospiraceae bacterium]